VWYMNRRSGRPNGRIVRLVAKWDIPVDVMG